ncbi:polysaccharide deacetylase family protein [bacterium]|nr:polysaccharide deacetylase family protein [bacterium]
MSDAPPPSRSLPARLRRRAVQWTCAAPATLAAPAPVLSFAFDDFPKSALDGADIIERHGGRAGFFACTSYLNTRRADYGDMFDAAAIRALSEREHEIGGHSHMHPNYALLPARAIIDDLDQNTRSLNDLGLRGVVKSFAYPFGETSVTAKRLVASRYLIARGALSGFNSGMVDRAQLRAVALGPDGAHHRRACRMLKAAARRPAWLMLFTHDVSRKPSAYGVTPQCLDDLCRRAIDLGFRLATPTDAALSCGLAASTPGAASPQGRPAGPRVQGQPQAQAVR